MTIRLRSAFFIITGLILIWFFYAERAILTPFILAGIFAYVFNPIINFLSNKIKVPRTLSILVIYVLIISALVAAGMALTNRIFSESSDLSNYIKTITITAHHEIDILPNWIRPSINDTLLGLEHSKFFSSQTLFILFPQALSRLVSFTIFLFAGFYFLREGGNMIDRLLALFPSNYRFELEILIRKTNAVLNGYLRGQIFMIFFVSLVLFVVLSVLGVRFALILAIFSGFAEIIPFIGPIIATAVAAASVYLTGNLNFALNPIQGALVVTVIYVAVRQFQDYFIVPHVMGRITKLHPLIILFAVLAGENIGGVLGVVLAVPIAATLRIFLEYCMDKINEQKLK